MWLAVPLGPFLRILQTEVGRQIDHPGSGCQQLCSQPVGHTMGGREEHHVASAERGRVRHAKGEPVIVAAQVGIHIRHLDAVFRARGDHDHFGLRMLRQQTQQLDSGITCAADDADLDHALPSRVNR